MDPSAAPDPPPRPDESPDQGRREQRWLPLLCVLGLIAFVTLGARGIAAPNGTSPPVGFDGVVQLRPEPGWTEQARSEQDGSHQLLLTRGAVALYVGAVEDSRSTAAEVAIGYARSLSDELSDFQPGSPAPVTLSSGRPAVRFGFVGVTSDGVQIEGSVTALVTDRDVALVFEARAHRGDLGWAAPDIERMIDGAEIS